MESDNDHGVSDEERFNPDGKDNSASHCETEFCMITVFADSVTNQVENDNHPNTGNDHPYEPTKDHRCATEEQTDYTQWE
jgi:hypothetical protein